MDPFQPADAQPPASPAPTAHPKGTTVLVLGILGMCCFGALTGAPAWVMGASALGESRRSPGRYSNDVVLKTGMWLGIASTLLSVVALVGIFAAGAIFGFRSYLERARGAQTAANTQTFTTKNRLVRAHYPGAFAARSVDEGTLTLAHNLADGGDEAVVIGAVGQPISDELVEFARVLDLAGLKNFDKYAESARQPATCFGARGLETRGHFEFGGKGYVRWACTFIRAGHGYQFSYLVTDGDAAAREPALKAIVNATELLDPGVSD